MGYTFSMGPVRYGAKDGHPLSLAECWQTLIGVGDCAIWAPNGRMVCRRGLGGPWNAADGRPVRRRGWSRRAVLAR